MSDANVALIRRGTQAFNAGSDEWVADSFSSDAVMHHPPAWPEPGPSIGTETIASQFARLREDVGSTRLVEESVTGQGDRLVMRLRWELEGASSGAAGATGLSAAYRFRDGRIAELEFYFDHDEALAAAGLADA